MLELNTSDFGIKVKVKIDGHDYTVRRLGAGEELKVGSLLRRMRKLLRELAKPETSEERSDEIEALVDGMEQESMKLMAGTFDDGGDGSKSIALINGLTHEEREQMIRKVFAGVPNETEKPVVSAESDGETDSEDKSESN